MSMMHVREERGSGIGLYVVRRIIDMFGWEFVLRAPERMAPASRKYSGKHRKQ
jgi:nitrogen fixation/metabolism regulation signal transduction histidine kinase